MELITLIFNLALSEYEQTYKLRTKNYEIKRIVTEDFAQMGLVEFTVEKDKFYITKLMQSFLLTQIGVQSQDEEVKEGPNDKFIIVETNFRVFAYTTNKLYKEIMKQFIEPKIEYPDMLYGQLTK